MCGIQLMQRVVLMWCQPRSSKQSARPQHNVRDWEVGLLEWF